MLWCDNYCFLHYPKTAGKTLTRYFVESWGAPVYGYVSKGQIKELAGCDFSQEKILIGRGHENISEADEILRGHGKAILEMDAVFVGIRNPYDLMVSNYHFMRETYVHNQDKRNFIVAHESDFDTFCETVGVASPRSWMEMNGKPVPNLNLVRFENLKEDLEKYSAEFQFEPAVVTHLNSSRRGHYRDYLTPRSENAIYKRFRYYFGKGFYQRETEFHFSRTGTN